MDHIETDIKPATDLKSASQLLADRDADTFGNWPVGQAGITGAPDIKGLDADCAKIVWYTVLSADPTKVIKGDFLAQFKTFAKQAAVEKLLQNAVLKDIKVKPSDTSSGKKDWDDSFDVKFVQGTMSSQAVCFLMHQELVSLCFEIVRVETDLIRFRLLLLLLLKQIRLLCKGESYTHSTIGSVQGKRPCLEVVQNHHIKRL